MWIQFGLFEALTLCHSVAKDEWKRNPGDIDQTDRDAEQLPGCCG